MRKYTLTKSDYKTYKWEFKNISNVYKDLYLIKIPYEYIKSLDFDQCKEPAQTLSDYYYTLLKKNNLETDTMKSYEYLKLPVVTINGGLFYLKDGTPVLTLIDEGKLINEENWLTTGFGILNGEKKINFVDLKDSEVKNNIRDFCTAYPILLKDGKKQPITYATELNTKQRRTIIGWNTQDTESKDVDESTQYLCIVIMDDDCKHTFEECQDILLDLGITNAGCLDGGTSTSCLIEDTYLVKTSRKVDNVFGVYLEDTYTSYVVNVGSFSQKNNAYNLLNKLHKLKTDVHDYSDAYIIYDEGSELYKIRVGFFTVYDNAKKMEKDLEDNGFDAFVVIQNNEMDYSVLYSFPF